MAATRSQNRRRAERKQCSKTVALVVDSGRDEISNRSFAVDLSQLGVRIRTGLNLIPGQQVTVIPWEGKEYAVPSRVIWVSGEPQASDQQAGLAFLEPQAASSALLAETSELAGR